MRSEKERRRLTRILNQIATMDKDASLLMTVPGVGASTALCFVSTIENTMRFPEKHQISSYLGLAPKVFISSEMHFAGRITK